MDGHATRLPAARGLFEAHLPVVDLDRAIAFYRDVVGLVWAHGVASRRCAFFWVGSPGRSMLGLWEEGSGPHRITMHVAIEAALEDLLAAPAALRQAGVVPLDFDGVPTDAPVVLCWMPAASLYFRDPDGHLLEYVAMLDAPPCPERGIVSWREWRRPPRSL